jgi:hypothetical protein
MAPLSRTILLLAVTVAAIALCGCAVQVMETDEYAETFSRAGAGRVVIRGVDGDVVARGMAVDDVEIHGTRYSIGATRRAAREGLKHAVLDAAHRAGDLTLSFDPPFAFEGLVDLELDRVSTLPREMDLSVSVESGDLDVSGIAGALDLESVRGDIDIDDPGTEFVRASVGTGDVRYSIGLVGFYMECSAPGGTVEIDDGLIAAGAIRTSDADGTIVVRYGDELKRVELTATDGRIEVSLNDTAP